jgi:transcriptional regulator with XRE-family HTH domain
LLNTVNRNIKALRQCLGLSQAAFGDLLGVSPPTISEIESGKTPVKNDLIKKITKVFHIELHRLTVQNFWEVGS